ncbi:hypothetical protein V1514DRAFT_331390 [Lipomyces japonicus]|uniref:uncharacterized protein n=1 Tax=Lipomyces japonicus TaxID=56871 RepID=UPI0034D00F74
MAQKLKRSFPWESVKSNNANEAKLKTEAPSKHESDDVGASRPTSTPKKKGSAVKKIRTPQNDTSRPETSPSTMASEVNEEYMKPGDEKYRMVEDEFYDIAREYAAPEHYARYARVQKKYNSKRITTTKLNANNEAGLAYTEQQDIDSDNEKFITNDTSTLGILLSSPVKETVDLGLFNDEQEHHRELPMNQWPASSPLGQGPVEADETFDRTTGHPGRNLLSTLQQQARTSPGNDKQSKIKPSLKQSRAERQSKRQRKGTGKSGMLDLLLSEE